ncbi:MAG: HpcH/HpaI aldolase family protein [Woeseiaceae bacterium]
MGKSVDTFRKRLIKNQPLIGTFLKTPSAIAAEVLSYSDLDVFCIDTEHAPFGRLETDHCLAAFRAADKPSLVRVANNSTTEIRSALDSGATGILVPHVTSAEQARAIVKAAHFGDGGRGFAGSTRAASYTTKPMADHIADSGARTTVIVQIEDIAALEHVAQIAAVEGVDAIFVGRVDLAVAMKKSPMDKEIIATVHDICAAGRGEGTAVGMFTPDLKELPEWQEAGASLFLLSSDQSMILSGANALAQAIR